MKILNFTLTMMSALLGGSLLTYAESPKLEGSRPNIVLIITDDHSTQALGVDGHSIIPLPELNKLGKEGMVFDRSFCCNSICGPSRAAILTGRHSHKNGFFTNTWNHFDGKQPTYAKALQSSGYQTGYIGKWHLESTPTGFDFWELLPGQGSYYNPDFKQMNGKNIRRPGYATDVITDMSIDWMKNRDKTKPFMLVVGHKAPHRAWAPALRHLGKVDGKSLTPPADLHDTYEGRPDALAQNEQSIKKHLSWASDLKVQMDRVPADLQKGLKPNWALGELNRMNPEQKAEWEKFYQARTNELIEGLKPNGPLHDEKKMTEWKWRAYMEDYLSCLLAVDESVGKIKKFIDDEGLGENTLIVYCGDQSFFLGEHGLYDKRWALDESLKMPLIMRWKGHIQPNTVSNALVQNIDYAPTFTALAGSDPKLLKAQGTSLIPLLNNGGKAPKNWRKGIYYAYYEWPGEHNAPKHDAVRTEDYLLAYLPRTDEWMAFDIKNDPQELKNIANDSAHKNKINELKKIYQELRTQYDVPADFPGKTKERNVVEVEY